MTTVYFATNRRLDNSVNPPEFLDEFAGDPEDLRFGSAEVPGEDLFENNDLKAIGRDAAIQVAAEELHGTDANESVLGSTEIFGQLMAQMADGKDLLIMVHGYNYEFRESVVRAAQIAQWYDDPARERTLFLFSWPSLGDGVGKKTYLADQERAAMSGGALGRTLLKLTDFVADIPVDERPNGKIHLLAHSMGNHALQNGVQKMVQYMDNASPPRFDEVVLMAADAVDDTLSHSDRMAPLLDVSDRVSVYYNVQDLALVASRFMGNPARLGRQGPRNRAVLPGNVTSVNAAPAIIWTPEVSGPDFDGETFPVEVPPDWQIDIQGHQYYRNNPVVRDDVRQVLAGIPDDAIAGRSERVGYYRIG